MVLKTARTYIREFNLNDAEAVFRFNGNPEVTRYTGDADMVQSLEDAKEVITNIWLKEYAEQGYGRWAVVDKATDEVIGFCGFKYIPELGMPDLGYRFLPEYWGQGLATETALACQQYAEQHLGIKKYFADVMPDNRGSVRIIEKLGLVFDGIITEQGERYRRYFNSINP